MLPCFRFTIPEHVKPVRTWDVEWNLEDDVHLLRGVYEHGLGSWDSIKLDPELKLKEKLLPLDKKMKPQWKHAQTRVEFLMNFLRKIYGRTTTKQSGTKSVVQGSQGGKIPGSKKRKKADETIVPQNMIHTKRKSKATHEAAELAHTASSGRSSKKYKSKDIIDSDDDDEEEGGGKKTTMSKKKSTSPNKKQAPGNTKRADTDKAGHHKSHHRHHHDKGKGKKPKKSGDDTKKGATDTGSGPVEAATGSDTELELDPTTFKECKTLMRPHRDTLKQISSADSDESRAKYLSVIGDHIVKCVKTKSQGTKSLAKTWRKNLWTFISLFTEGSWEELHNLYEYQPEAFTKHAKKLKEETEEHGTGEDDKKHKNHHNHHHHKDHHKRSKDDKSSTTENKHGSGNPNSKSKQRHLDRVVANDDENQTRSPIVSCSLESAHSSSTYKQSRYNQPARSNAGGNHRESVYNKGPGGGSYRDIPRPGYGPNARGGARMRFVDNSSSSYTGPSGRVYHDPRHGAPAPNQLPPAGVSGLPPFPPPPSGQPQPFCGAVPPTMPVPPFPPGVGFAGLPPPPHLLPPPPTHTSVYPPPQGGFPPPVRSQAAASLPPTDFTVPAPLKIVDPRILAHQGQSSATTAASHSAAPFSPNSGEGAASPGSSDIVSNESRTISLNRSISTYGVVAHSASSDVSLTTASGQSNSGGSYRERDDIHGGGGYRERSPYSRTDRPRERDRYRDMTSRDSYHHRPRSRDNYHHHERRGGTYETGGGGDARPHYKSFTNNRSVGSSNRSDFADGRGSSADPRRRDGDRNYNRAADKSSYERSSSHGRRSYDPDEGRRSQQSHNSDTSAGNNINLSPTKGGDSTAGAVGALNTSTESIKGSSFDEDRGDSNSREEGEIVGGDR